MLLQKLLTGEHRIAAFLDVDGTLIDIAPTPSSVVVTPSLLELLYRLWIELDGALALVSGRPLEDLDRLFKPYRFPAAGTHGCEIREPNGCVAVSMVDVQAVRVLHEDLALIDFLAPDILVEYKPFGAAIHYRLSPYAGPEVLACAQELCGRAGPDFVIQRGKCVCEIKPVGISKGTAIRALMGTAPFLGRRPMFIGDDFTDESGFEAVNLSGGLSVRVGAPTAVSLARFSLASPSEVHALLHELAQRSS